LTPLRPKSKRLVVDVDLLVQCGKREKAPDPRMKSCRRFLVAVRDICHHVAFNESLFSEWKRHKTSWASKWLTQMMARRKFEKLEDNPDSEISAAIIRVVTDRNTIAKMQKDQHLLEIALATDKRIISLNDKERFHFSKCCDEIKNINTLIWVNPTCNPQEVIAWLENGAEYKAEYTLGFQND
jgi:hypothetical protein